MSKNKVRIYVMLVILIAIIAILVKSQIDFQKHIIKLEKPIAPAELAKMAVEKYITNKDIILTNHVAGIEKHDSGLFVSIISRKTGLRGCVGVTKPHIKNTGGEIVRLAILTAVSDRRFPPITKDELDDLYYIVDIMHEPEKISDLSELDPKKYGVLVKSGLKKGVVLPDLPGLTDVNVQVREAKYNGDINEEANVDIYRFTVNRFTTS